MSTSIPEKANRVLNFLILGMLLIFVRVWYLDVIQRDEHLEKARKPQRRSVIEKVERGTIRDRFAIPLAFNQVQYNASICYADIRQIPSVKWEKRGNGKKVKVQARSEYIQNLAILLANLLQLDPQDIEDTIHGKASLFPHTPFTVKEDISERQYYQLKALEMDWLGIRAERSSKRNYPLKKVGADVIGHMGSISSQEYQRITGKIQELQAYISQRDSGETPILPKGFHHPLEAREYLKELQEKSYTIRDCVGKMGVEGGFDSDLRGFTGKSVYEIDTKGNPIRKLPGGREPIPAQQIALSISSELQEYAEQLLTSHEQMREGRLPNGQVDWEVPWIKGGAIVAMDPNNGEILALASYPRYDPNDFIPSADLKIKKEKQKRVIQWLENERSIGDIWDGKQPLRRERFNENRKEFYEETVWMSLDIYFSTIFPAQSDLLKALRQVKTIREALFFQKEGEKIVTHPFLHSIALNQDRFLFLDICRMLVCEELFSEELEDFVGDLPLSDYYQLTQSTSCIRAFLQEELRPLYHQIGFQEWRREHFKEYLKSKRKEEKEKKRYAQPYTEYLERLEKEMFAEFWKHSQWPLIQALASQIPPEETVFTPYWEKLLVAKDSNPTIKDHLDRVRRVICSLPISQRLSFLQTMRSFEELTRPLIGAYRTLRNDRGIQQEKHLAAAFYPLARYGYGRSQAFRQSTPQGSVFKLIVAYQGLLERFLQMKQDLNPLTLIDNIQWHKLAKSHSQVFGYFLDGSPITRLHKGGILPRSHPNTGKIDVIGAIEQSSNLYFPILSSEYLSTPLALIDASKQFGLGEKTGIELPGEIPGELPLDITYNKTGLYALSIGQHSLIVTPLQTAVMLSALGNQGHLLKPQIIRSISGKGSFQDDQDPFSQLQSPFQEILRLVGVHFPLFTATSSKPSYPYFWYHETEVKRSIPLPSPVRDPIIEGMVRVINGPRGTARPHIIRAFSHRPDWKANYLNLRHQIIGKTSTAEILFKQSIDAESRGKIRNHIGFGTIAFFPDDQQKWEKPELVVVVYLRFSETGGKEAAPLATEVINKWRQIKARSN